MGTIAVSKHRDARTPKTGKDTRRTDWVEATLSEFDGVRFLHLDSIWVQGAMRLKKPEKLELEYVQRMMAWMLWRDARDMTQGTAVQLGLGAGALTRFDNLASGGSIAASGRGRSLRMRISASRALDPPEPVESTQAPQVIAMHAPIAHEAPR